MFTTFDKDLNPADYVCVFIRGDRDVNMIKLVNALGIPEHYIEFADEDDMGPITGIVGGFTGPVGIHNCKIVVDSELVGTKNMVAGANKEDHHMTGVCYGRDFTGDIRVYERNIQGRERRGSDLLDGMLRSRRHEDHAGCRRAESR